MISGTFKYSFFCPVLEQKRSRRQMADQDTYMVNIEDYFYPVADHLPTCAYRYAHVKEKLLPCSEAWEQGIIAVDAKPNSASKQYLRVGMMMLYLYEICYHWPVDEHAYEVVEMDRPVRPYFDLEWDADALPDANNVLCAFLSVAKEALYAIGCNIIRSIAIYSASGSCSTAKIKSGHKHSFHVLFDCDRVFHHTVDHGLFVNRIVMPLVTRCGDLHWTDPERGRLCVVDTSPYATKQHFRLPSQSKWCEDVARPLEWEYTIAIKPDLTHEQIISTIYTIGIYEDPSTLSYFSVGVAEQRVARRIIEQIHVKGSESTEFDKAVELSAFLTPTFLTEYNTTTRLIWMLWGLEQTQRMRDLIHRLCARGRNYHEDTDWPNKIIKGYKFQGSTVGSLVHWARECAGPTRCAEVDAVLQKYVRRYVDEIFTIKWTPMHRTAVNQRYLSPELLSTADARCMIIQSHLGTGKTCAIQRLLQEYQSVLVVSPRRSYTYAQYGELASLGFVSYMDHEGPLTEFSRLILQVESLHRVAMPFVGYDLVILDESESILAQLHSTKTHRNYLISNHQTLERIVAAAKKIVLADAFISDRTLRFAQELCGASECHMIENTFQPYAREAIQLMGGATQEAEMAAFSQRIMCALEAGRRAVVVWTSKEAGLEFVAKHLEHSNIAWQFYHADSPAAIMEDLQDVRSAWANLQCLMYTTTITVGISYDPEEAADQFDEAFLYGYSLTGKPRDIAQALLRVRTLTLNRLTYLVHTSPFHRGECGIANVEVLLRTLEERVLRDHPLANWVTCPSWVRNNIVYNENELRCSAAYYKDVLEEYLVRSGYRLHMEQITVSDAAHDTEDSSDSKEDREEQAVAWHDVPTLTGICEIARIKQRVQEKCATEQEQLAWNKYHIRTHFVEGCPEEVLIDVWNRMAVSGKMGAFWNIVAESMTTLASAARREAQRRYPMLTDRRLQQRGAVAKLLGVLGMEHSQQEAAIDGERLAALKEPLQAIAGELRKGMGLRESQKKSATWDNRDSVQLIRSVLVEWGCCTVDYACKKRKVNKETIREYILYINKGSKIYENIVKVPIKVDEEINE